jgi:hypothetical protein
LIDSAALVPEESVDTSSDKSIAEKAFIVVFGSGRASFPGTDIRLKDAFRTDPGSSQFCSL